MSKLYINKHVKIFNNTVFFNSQKDYEYPNINFVDFFNAIYQHYNIQYRKFYKMDALSKLGFLSVELLLKQQNIDQIKPEEIAVICANSSSSLHTDIHYQNTISDIPSPAVFVYTLPNIVIGEICIRNNIKGEATFFVQKDFDIELITNYITYIFDNTNTKRCITGWLEVNSDGQYHANMFLISKNKSNIIFNNNNLHKLYTYE